MVLFKRRLVQVSEAALRPILIGLAAFHFGCANSGDHYWPGLAEVKTHTAYFAKSSGGDLAFRVQKVDGYGDCALLSIERTRDEFVKELRAHIHEPHFQDVLREDVFDTLRNEDSSLTDPWTDLTLDRFNHYIDTKLQFRTEYLTFVPQKELAQEELPEAELPYTELSQGTFAAAAELFHMNVRIWEPRFEKEPKRLQLLAKLIFAPENKEFHDVLYTGKNHFDRLIRSPVLRKTQEETSISIQN